MQVLETVRETEAFAYDIKYQDSTGEFSRLVQGEIYVSPQVTV